MYTVRRYTLVQESTGTSSVADLDMGSGVFLIPASTNISESPFYGFFGIKWLKSFRVPVDDFLSNYFTTRYRYLSYKVYDNP